MSNSTLKSERGWERVDGIIRSSWLEVFQDEGTELPRV